MSTSDIDRIRQSWSLAMANPTQTSTLFYSNLFRIDETAKPLFVGDLALQGRKLMETLGFIVDHLEEPETLLPAAEDLAKAHVSYGVTQDQYAGVGQALILTLQQLLGVNFTPEDEQAWGRVYTSLADHMISVAYD
ncbi:MAG: hemin receptor [Rhodobacteraceae bacterium]|nr:hemin receptor [Paracoccaceae bacterium]